MATVDTLNIEITTNANAAADSIRNLTRVLNNLNKNLNDTKLDNISKQFASLNSALGNISSTNLLKLSKLTSTLEKYAKVKNIKEFLGKEIADTYGKDGRPVFERKVNATIKFYKNYLCKMLGIGKKVDVQTQKSVSNVYFDPGINPNDYTKETLNAKLKSILQSIH